MQDELQVSERVACRALALPRSTKRYKLVRRDDEDELTEAITYLASNYGRYGYRRITAMLHREGFKVNHKRVERIWRELGLKVPRRQPKKRRIWLNDGSCVRMRPEHSNHVWSYDFVEDALANGRKIRWLNIIDEYDRRLIACIPRRSWRGNSVIDALGDAFLIHGYPEYIRSDNGSEFVSQKVREYLAAAEVQTLYIEPGSPWGNGCCESFNSKMRDEFLNGEIFETWYEVEVLTRQWINYYNNERPHSSLGYKPPAIQVIAA